MTIDHLHNKEESGNDDIGEVSGQEGEQEGGQDAVLCAHTGGCYCYCFLLLLLFLLLLVIVIVMIIIIQWSRGPLAGNVSRRAARM